MEVCVRVNLNYCTEILVIFLEILIYFIEVLSQDFIHFDKAFGYIFKK